jgi:hypothetical protein
MQTLLDLRYSSPEHLAFDLKALTLNTKQYYAIYNRLRHHIGARIRLERKSSTILLTVYADNLKLTAKASVKGVISPFACPEWD